MASERGTPEDDIGPILNRWAFEGDSPRVRYLDASDGVRWIQVRVDGGILQFHCKGRPDGERPEGFESWLEYWESNPGSIGGGDINCLLEEASLYRQRAAAYLALEEFDAAAMDCDRNVRVSQLATRRVAPVNAARFEGMGLANTFLATRARVAKAIQLRDMAGALAAIDRGLGDISMITGDGPGCGEPGEAAILRAMRGALVPKLPSSQRVELEARLLEAIRTENFELAAILRDELRQIGY